jgi:hypothetical protein
MALKLNAVTSRVFNWPINRVINPNPAYSHAIHVIILQSFWFEVLSNVTA